MPFNGGTINERSLGGSETAAYYMAKGLAALGHKVTLFTNMPREGCGEFDGVNYVASGEINENAPLGRDFTYYATHTPHDVLIIQRHPAAFATKYASKLNFWWLHDLALHRMAPHANSHMWNIDRVLCVSDCHKQQICDVYGFEKAAVSVLRNGIDLSLFEGELTKDNPDAYLLEGYPDRIHLLYSSRPERGLENHVKPGGIMERLWEIDKRFHLYVCAYDNVTAKMKPLYEALWQRCEELPNVTNLGSLTKQELADVMRQCDALVYPTKFEEVSCITAMEAMAAGLPFISSEHAALPETCKGSGSILIPLKDGEVDVEKFVNVTINLHESKEKDYSVAQLEAAKTKTWRLSAKCLQEQVEDLFWDLTRDEGAVISHLIENSDIYALYSKGKDPNPAITLDNGIINAKLHELKECYAFTQEEDWGGHYETYYQYETDRGVEYGPENLDNNSRFEYVSGIVGALPADSSILDYGCAHGHYTVNLAKRFPNKTFVGIDICQSNIDKARKWADDEGLTNVRFYAGQIKGRELAVEWADGSEQPDSPLDFNMIIAAEVLEHVADPATMVEVLNDYLKSEGTFLETTPWGPWEAIGYKEHWPWRAHVHHFEREDLHDKYKEFPDFRVVNVPVSPLFGSYVTTFNKFEGKVGKVNYERKLQQLAPKQTVSLCMIARDAESTIRKCLESAMPIVDELIIGIDKETTDNTINVIEQYMFNHWPEKSFESFIVESPTKIGFDAARNMTIEKASGQWILWLDADEELHVDKNSLNMFLRHNQFNGYGIAQHHFSMQPLGVLKTDYPCRLFRNHRGIKFFGKVHEHPEIEMNKGVGSAMILHGIISIAHNAYKNEDIRIDRFNRNIGLLDWDRKENPDRLLGKFLWLRDMAQMCEQEMRFNGGQISPAMIERAQEGIQIYEELLAAEEIKMLVDGLEFYSTLTRIVGVGFDFGFKIDASKLNGGVHLEQALPVQGHFLNRRHLDLFMDAIVDEKVKNYESRYF
jgi:glycosyltransferase involved in cell wall biosynthesis/2-polyprenyl-3-methyl-5-hydroxy-6-metoxy-1,4-benzoquinol methylase